LAWAKQKKKDNDVIVGDDVTTALADWLPKSRGGGASPEKKGPLVIRQSHVETKPTGSTTNQGRAMEARTNGGPTHGSLGGHLWGGAVACGGGGGGHRLVHLLDVHVVAVVGRRGAAAALRHALRQRVDHLAQANQIDSFQCLSMD